MEAQICPSCKSILPERAVFCPACATQVRCKACHDLLEPKAHACVSCGSLVGELAPASLGNRAGVASRAVNTLQFEETDRRRSLRAEFTDEAVGSLSGTIGLLMAGRLGFR